MRILVLGGTKFLGRAIVTEALQRGHDTTLFTRGRTNPTLFPSASHVRGDRTVSLDGLNGRSFDVVVDTSAYHPDVVGLAVAAIDAGSYCFISTISVYADPSRPGLREDDALATVNPVPAEFVADAYGALKALCERVVTAGTERSLIVRPGLIVGPHDDTDRFTYWAVRASRGGRMLAPGRPDRRVQFIDVRDLASWTLDAVEQDLRGTFNTTGPSEGISMSGVLEACCRAAGTRPDIVWADEGFLLAHGVEPWSDLPLWLPGGGEFAGIMQMDCSAASAKGLRTRPVEQTARDTLAWFAAERSDQLRAGLSPQREQDLLDAFPG